MALDDRQKKYLRGLAHDLKPLVHVGSAGVTPGVVAELDHNLAHHELVKIRVRADNGEARAAAVAELVARSGAELIGRVGHVAILYRRNREDPVIALP